MITLNDRAQRLLCDSGITILGDIISKDNWLPEHDSVHIATDGTAAVVANNEAYGERMPTDTPDVFYARADAIVDTLAEVYQILRTEGYPCIALNARLFRVNFYDTPQSDVEPYFILHEGDTYRRVEH